MPKFLVGEPMEDYAAKRGANTPKFKFRAFRRPTVGGSGSSPSFNPLDLSPIAYFQWNVGITEAGQGVSVWADQSGNGNDLLQGTDGNRPAKQADGSILFDGVDNFLTSAGFTLTIPYTIYLLGKQITWTANDRVFSGSSGSDVTGVQTGVSPSVNFTSGGTVANADWTIGVYAALAVVFAAGGITARVNNNATASGSGATNDMAGFQLAVYTDGIQQFSNIQVKEVILYSGAHNSAQQQNVINYLMRIGGI